MKSILIEEGVDAKKAYESLVLEPRHLSMLANPLSIRILQSLAAKPGCALDLARSLEENEQKIYYHLRKLEGAGIVKLLRTEKRFGMTAKIFDVVSPVVATKLFEKSFGMGGVSSMEQITEHKFLHPFVESGELSAKIILGYPYPHGEFDVAAADGAHAFDIAMLLGSMVQKERYSRYVFDVDATLTDLNNHLILLGNPHTNTVIQKINAELPVFFDNAKGKIVSKASGKSYSDPWVGVIMKIDNPLSPGKKMLVLGGLRTRGVHAAVLGVTKYLSAVLDGTKGDVVRIVAGMDKDGDKVIDSIKVLE